MKLYRIKKPNKNQKYFSVERKSGTLNIFSQNELRGLITKAEEILDIEVEDEYGRFGFSGKLEKESIYKQLTNIDMKIHFIWLKFNIDNIHCSLFIYENGEFYTNQDISKIQDKIFS